MKRLAILISGRGSNMQAIARETRTGVLSGLADVAVVISNKPDALGLKVAHDMGIETRVLPSRGKRRKTFDKALVHLLDSYHPDLVVLAGFMRILGPGVVKRFQRRIVNIHPADTREHQGLDGYEWAFENRLSKTRITVHYVDQGLDTGEIIAQHDVDLSGAETLEEVERRGLAVEHRFYSDVLKDLLTTQPSTDSQ